MTTRGLGVAETRLVADWIAAILRAPDDEDLRARVRASVDDLCRAFPIYPELSR